MENENCIFCKMVRGEIPIEKVFENKKFIAILDAFPILNGQLLVIPKEHISSYVFDLDNEIYTEFMLLAKKLAKRLDKSIRPIKTGMIIEGLEVPHAHIKLLPLMDKKGYNLKPMKQIPSKEELKLMAEKITRKR